MMGNWCSASCLTGLLNREDEDESPFVRTVSVDHQVQHQQESPAADRARPPPYSTDQQFNVQSGSIHQSDVHQMRSNAVELTRIDQNNMKVTDGHLARTLGLLNELPIDTFIEGGKGDVECAICMVDFEEGDKMRFLPCLHSYHVKCIDDWLLRSFVCPSCLEPVDSGLLCSYTQQSVSDLNELCSSPATAAVSPINNEINNPSKSL